ncbi:hypothetical protein JCM11641_005029 [Rhodosporidiobolus odoratus]
MSAPKTPSSDHTRTNTTSSHNRPSAPPPSLPLPPLPPPSAPGSRATGPALPPLPPLPSLPLPTLFGRFEDGAVSPVSSRFSTNSFPSTSNRDTISTRPSSAGSTPPSPPLRLKRSKSVTAEGIEFDLVTPHLGPSLAALGPSTASSSPPDTPTTGGGATPRALVAQAEAEAAACGCDALPESPLSPWGEEEEDYDEEAERLLTEAGLGGLGLGLLRRQSEAVFLARIANGGRASIAVPPTLARLVDPQPSNSTFPADPPPVPLSPKIASPAAAKLLRKKKEEREKLEAKVRKEQERSAKKGQFDRFGLPTVDAIEASRHCTLLGEGGVQVTFGQLLKERKKKVVVVFLRHAWCGLCAQFVEALNRATANLNALSSAASSSAHSSTSDSPHIPPLYILLISSGSAALIPTYRARLDCPFPLYMDRTRRLYKTLGMNKKTWSMGKEEEKGSYIVKSNMGNIVSSTAAGLAMPHYPGSQTQLGGEFVFDYDEAVDEIRCCYAARMHNTRAHSEIRDLFAAAGVELNDLDAASVYGG